jgi:hypothetical protein
MRLSLGTYSIETTSYASRRELEKALQRIGGWPEVIDVASGEGSAFYLLKFGSEIKNPSQPNRHMGLCACRTGIEPQILLHAPLELVHLGLDSSLLIFSICTGLIKRLTLPSPFYWMSFFADLDTILVQHEIGLLSLNPKGDIVWSYDAGDIITSFALRAPRTLELGLFEGGRVTVDLVTGRTQSSSPN